MIIPWDCKFVDTKSFIFSPWVHEFNYLYHEIRRCADLEGAGGGGGRLVGLGSSSGNFRPILFISIIVKLSTTTKMKRTFLPSFEKFIFSPRSSENLFSSNLIHHKKKMIIIKYVIQRLLQDRIWYTCNCISLKLYIK